MAKLRFSVGACFEELVRALAEPLGPARLQHLRVMLGALQELQACLQDVIAADAAELAKQEKN